MSEKITTQDIAEAAESYSCIFGANKNLYRVTPVLQDGLKPGKRRIFWAWWLNTGTPQTKNMKEKNKFRKVSRIASDAMAYHPHGDGANEAVIGREGQYWNNNIMTIVPKGNYGSMRGDKVAAGRYIEAAFSEYLIDCFFDDFEKYCVPMKMSYDGEGIEPEYLPAKYPHALFNHQLSGIGYGTASNIPPFNVSEVLKATIKLIKDPTETVMLIPDSPTGCEIIDEGEFKQMNETGEGKFTLRASVEIDYQKNIIRVTSLPINSSSMMVINSIIELKKRHLFEEIVNINDYTKLGSVDIRIHLKPDANPDKVLEKLYKKKTMMKMTYPIGIKFIDNYKEFQYSTKRFLLEWIDYRRDAIRAMLNNDLIQVMEKQHINEALIKVSEGNNAEDSVKIAKKSSGRKDNIDRLVKKFNISSIQGSAIADMKIYNLNADYNKGLKEKEKKLKKEVEEIERKLGDDKEIDKLIISQLEEGIKKYGRPRMSPVIKERDNEVEENIPNTYHLIGISESGYIKKIGEENSSIGSVGKINDNLIVCKANNRDSLLVVDSAGMVCKIPVSSVPDMRFEDTGVEISRYFSTKGGIKAFLLLQNINILKNSSKNHCILLITKQGYGKRVSLSEFKKISSMKSAITLNEGDEVVSAMFIDGGSTKDVVIVTNTGRGIRLPIDEIKLYGRTAKGISQITMEKGEYVTSSSRVDPNKKILFYVTSAGRVKVTQEKYFPVMSRKSKPIQLITLENNESLVGITSVTKQDHVMVYRKHNEPVLIDVKELPMSTRIAKAEKKVKTPKGDFVVSFKVFKE